MMNLHMYSAAMFHGNDGRSSETSDPLELLLLLLMKLTVNSPSYEPTAIRRSVAVKFGLMPHVAGSA